MKVLLIILILAMDAWIVVDALYWGSSDFPSLFPHSRYVVLAAIGTALALVLWVLIYAIARIFSKKKH